MCDVEERKQMGQDILFNMIIACNTATRIMHREGIEYQREDSLVRQIFM